jgi:hypothetical protein
VKPASGVAGSSIAVMMNDVNTGNRPPIFGRSPEGRPDWFWISSPYRIMRNQSPSDYSPGAKKYQRVLWWMIGIGIIAAMTFFVVMLVLLRR